MQRTRYSIVGLLIAAALTAPLALSAQTVTDIQTQIQQLLAQIAQLQRQLIELRTGTTTPAMNRLPSLGVRHNICLIVRTLGEGEENDDIRTLQEYLREQGLLNASATGYFGLLTRDALRRWQANNGIVSEGDAATTGWGVFGPRTRSFIARWCAGNTGSTPQDVFHPIGATSTTAGNLPPTISNFTGPTTLTVGETGTWTVTASDPEGQALAYSISWGEIGNALNTLLQLADLDSSGFTASSTFTHSYSKAGLYPVAVRVKDTTGGIAGASRLVRVNSSSTEEGNFCTADTHQCANGAWVGRTGPNCQFSCSANSSSCPSGAYWCEANQEDSSSGSGSAEGPSVVTDGSCWFNYQLVATGSWVAAYEEQFVAGPSYNKPCKLQIRTCQSGQLTGTYRFPTCTASDQQSGG